jgi:hypothetical protein
MNREKRSAMVAAHTAATYYQRPKVLTYATHPRRGRCRPASTTSLVARKESSRGAPRGAPLSHHRAYGSRTTVVSDNVQRGMKGSALRLVPVAMPRTPAAPRSPKVRLRHPRLRRGAASSPGLRRGNPVGSRCTTAASRPSNVTSCSLVIGFRPSPGTLGYYGLC